MENKFVDIIDIGKYFPGYGDFFKEQNISSEYWESEWEPEVKDYKYWEVIHCGKYRYVGNDIDIYVIQKVIDNKPHKILINKVATKPSNQYSNKNYLNKNIWSNIWYKIYQ